MKTIKWVVELEEQRSKLMTMQVKQLINDGRSEEGTSERFFHGWLCEEHLLSF